MNLRVRRGLVIAGVALSLVTGLASIRVAAALTAAAAPPPAPPVSMESLRSQLEAEQARSVALQSQLDDLGAVTSQLSDAVGSTGGQVALDGLSAKQLRERLIAAQAKLATASRLLKQAQARIAALKAVEAGAAGAAAAAGAGTGAAPIVTVAPDAPSSGGAVVVAPPPPPPPTAAPEPTPAPVRTPRPAETPEFHGTPEPQH